MLLRDDVQIKNLPNCVSVVPVVPNCVRVVPVVPGTGNTVTGRVVPVPGEDVPVPGGDVLAVPNWVTVLPPVMPTKETTKICSYPGSSVV